MRIVFDTITSMMIPEGNVTEIKDASGNVLWKAAPSEATVTITKTSAGSNCGVTIDGITYGGKGNTVSTTLTVPIGTVIYCTAFINDSDMQGYVSVNGITVAGGGVENYAYTVNGNVSISMSGSKDGGYIEITEL